MVVTHYGPPEASVAVASSLKNGALLAASGDAKLQAFESVLGTPQLPQPAFQILVNLARTDKLL